MREMTSIKIFCISRSDRSDTIDYRSTRDSSFIKLNFPKTVLFYIMRF